MQRISQYIWCIRFPLLLAGLSVSFLQIVHISILSGRYRAIEVISMDSTDYRHYSGSLVKSSVFRFYTNNGNIIASTGICTEYTCIHQYSGIYTDIKLILAYIPLLYG